jgi:hypothetical protein
MPRQLAAGFVAELSDEWHGNSTPRIVLGTPRPLGRETQSGR